MGRGRRLEVAGHLTVTELFERYRRAEDAALRSHLQVIWLRAQGWRTHEVARSTGYKPDWSAGWCVATTSSARTAWGTGERATTASRSCRKRNARSC